VGYDAGKRVKGRKIHALVDSGGLPIRVVVQARRKAVARRKRQWQPVRSR
jgi:DDE family transposase